MENDAERTARRRLQNAEAQRRRRERLAIERQQQGLAQPVEPNSELDGQQLRRQRNIDAQRQRRERLAVERRQQQQQQLPRMTEPQLRRQLRVRLNED